MPKTFSSDLFDLIHAMSKAEKRFFKLYSNKGNPLDNKQYVHLFDVIDKQLEYDEKKIIRKVPEIKKFSVVKNQLYNLVLKSISILHQEKRLSSAIRSKLDYIEILYHKGLFSQCEKLLSKTKKQAQKAELYEILLSIQKIEIRLLTGVRNFKNIQNYEDRLDQMQTERKDISLKIQNIHDYFELYFPLTVLFYQGSKFSLIEKEKLIKKAMKNELLKDERNALSGLAKATFHMTWSLYYFLNKETEKAYAHGKKRLIILQNHPHLIEDSFTDYLNNIKFVSRLATVEKEYIEALTWIGMIQSELETYNNIVDHGIKDHFALQIHIAKLELFHSEQQWNDIIRYYLDVKNDLKRLENQNDPVLLNIQFLMAQAYFFTASFHQSLKYVNLILNNKFTGLHADKYRVIQLLNILIHYHLKNFELLDYITKSYQRANPKGMFKNDIDYLMIQFVIHKINNEKSAEKSLEKLKSVAEKLEKDEYFLTFFNLQEWIKTLR